MYSCIRAVVSEPSPQGLPSSQVFCPSRQKPRQAGTQAKEISARTVRKPRWIAASFMTGLPYPRLRDLLDCDLGSESWSAQG